MRNKKWSDKIIKLLDSSYRHRWEIYEKYLRGRLNKNTLWLDLGCGNNADIEEKKHKSFYALGVDIFKSDNLLSRPFLIADITCLPFKTNSVDLISSRFVIEHIADTDALFSELLRVLKPKGAIVLSTTNIWSPIILVTKLIPYPLRKQIIIKLFKVEDIDIFKTHHNFNSYFKFKTKTNKLNLLKLQLIQDLNSTNKIIFIIFFAWHFLTKISFLKLLRTNIIALYEKEI